MVISKIGSESKVVESLILVVVDQPARREQINLNMESSKGQDFELVTPVKVGRRSRIPVRSPGGGSSPFGRASACQSSLARSTQGLVNNLSIPGGPIILVPGKKEDDMDDMKKHPDKEYCLQEGKEWQKKEEVDEMITLKKEKVDNMVALKMEEKETDSDDPCNASAPEGDMETICAATNFVLSSPPAFASSPYRPVINVLSRSASIRSSPEEEEEHGGEGLSLSIWSRTEKTEQEDHDGQGLGLSILSRTEKTEQEDHGGQGLGLSILSRSEETEQDDHGGQGLGLSILREGGEGTLTDRILAAFVDCCFCA